MESAVHWAEGGSGEGETGDCLSAPVRVAEVDGWGRSEARECYSGPMTPEGEMTLTRLLLRLQREPQERKNRMVD